MAPPPERRITAAACSAATRLPRKLTATRFSKTDTGWSTTPTPSVSVRPALLTSTSRPPSRPPMHPCDLGDIGNRNPAVDRQHLRRYEAAIVASEESDRLGDVVDRTEPSHRRARDAARVELGIAVSHRAFGRNRRGRYRI